MNRLTEKIARGESLLKKIIVLWIVIEVIFLLLKFVLYGFALSMLIQTVIRAALIVFLSVYTCRGYMMARNCMLVLIAGNFVMSVYNIITYIVNFDIIMGSAILLMFFILTGLTIIFYAAAFMSILKSEDIRAYMNHKEEQRLNV